MHIDRTLTKWGKEPINEDDYVFDIINKSDSVDSDRKKNTTIYKSNKQMDEAGWRGIGLEIK